MTGEENEKIPQFEDQFLSQQSSKVCTSKTFTVRDKTYFQEEF